MNKLAGLEYKMREAVRLIEAEEARGTKRSLERAEEMRRLLASRVTDEDGWFGRLREVASHTSRSNQVRVARQGKTDACVKLLVNGRVRYEAAEVKTNGGRIASLREAGAPRFVIYSLNLCNAGTSYLPRRTPQVVMRTEDFLKLLEECRALKSTNGRNPEEAIQATSKRLFLAISEGLRFEADRVYKPEDFEA